MSDNWQTHARTKAAQALHAVDQATGAVVPPLHTSTTFARNENNELMAGWLYSRNGSPTTDHAQAIIAELEGASRALLFASGMGAVNAVIESLNAGERVACPQVMYHGVKNWLLRQEKKRDIGVDLFDPANPASLQAALKPGATKLVWIETPVNPSFDVIDIEAAANAAHAVGALLVVDGTCAPPCTTRALDHGADIIFHSATKYLNGHSDITAGVLAWRDTCERRTEIAQISISLGAMLGAFESWLLIRGMRTLFIRFETASANALKIAQALEHHPAIEAVLYPGLPSHAGHKIARKQMHNGFGGMLSICVKGGFDKAKRVTTALKTFTVATSLGGVESLAEHRKTVEGPGSLVPENLIRLSIGIESADDLIADLLQALEK
jgi:cystathionine gamma-synthase